VRRLCRYLHGFHGRGLLRGALFFDPFLFLVAEFVVTHEPHDGRFCGSGDLYEVYAIIRARERKRVGARHDAKILSDFADDAELGGSDLVVDTWLDNASIISSVVE
jgi:hypothetical protein